MLQMFLILVLCGLIHSGFALLDSKCPYKCNLLCPNGQQVDKQGCPMCRCNFEKQIFAPVHLSHCLPLFACPTLYCPFGHKPDSLGCPSCECSPNICGIEPLCTNQCPNGFVITELGCSTCTCKVSLSQEKSYCLPSICRSHCIYQRLGLPNPFPLPTNCWCDCTKSQNGYHMVFK